VHFVGLFFSSVDIIYYSLLSDEILETNLDILSITVDSIIVCVLIQGVLFTGLYHIM